MAADTDETTLLIRDGNKNGSRNGGGKGVTTTVAASAAAARTIFGPANRILLAGFLMAFTLGITQVP